MSSEQLATRILAEQAEISSEKIRRGMIDETEFRKLSEVAAEMSRIPLFIDQTGGITIAQLSARARKLKRQHGLDLLVVDYLQLLAGSKKGDGNRVQEITEITTGLKALAKELVVPIIALSQLSRQVENREDKRPQLSDLRESGSIEQDADVVMFVYRDEYYIERTKPAGRNARILRLDGQDEPCVGQGGSDHRQAASRPGWHGRTVVRRPIHALQQSGARIYDAGTVSSPRCPCPHLA